MRTRTLIIGMSHIGSLMSASAQRPIPGPKFILLNRQKLNASPDSALEEALSARPGRVDVLVLAIDGNHHNSLALLNHPQPFFLHPAAAHGKFIPQDMMLAYLTVQHMSALNVARLIVERFPRAQRIVLEPPPPAGDAAHIQRYPGVFAPMIHRGVSRDGVRLAVHDLQSQVYAEHARLLGARFIQIPNMARDATGKLAAQYCNPDPTHANADYGHLVLDAIEASIREPAA